MLGIWATFSSPVSRFLKNRPNAEGAGAVLSGVADTLEAIPAVYPCGFGPIPLLTKP
jgi:hypothetical protein